MAGVKKQPSSGNPAPKHMTSFFPREAPYNLLLSFYEITAVRFPSADLARRCSGNVSFPSFFLVCLYFVSMSFLLLGINIVKVTVSACFKILS